MRKFSDDFKVFGEAVSPSQFGANFGGYDPANDQFGSEEGADGDLQGVAIGIPPTVFGGAGQQIIEVGVTQPFRADKLVLESTSRVAGCVIEQMNISSVDQNIGNGDMPADMFTPKNTIQLAGNIVDPGVGIKLRVTTTGALTFRGTLFGPARPKGMVVQSQGKFDRVGCGIPLTAVGIGATEIIEVNTTKFFRAEQLVLNAAARVPGITIDQISISSNDQNRVPGNGRMPGETFDPDSFYRLRGTVVRPGVGIKLTVTNGTIGIVSVGGSFFGPALSDR